VQICDPRWPIENLVVKHLTKNQVLGGPYIQPVSLRE
jgi:hypothetical protein